MESFKGHPTALVADVDCTAAGKPLCDANGVKGYPTIKYGDPSDLQDYQGGRDSSALKNLQMKILNQPAALRILTYVTTRKKPPLASTLRWICLN